MKQFFTSQISMIVALTMGLLSMMQTKMQAKVYMSAEEAKKLIWGDTLFQPFTVEMTNEQMRTIEKNSHTHVRNAKLKTYRSENGDWYILDQVIGKHENIDIAVGITHDGKIKDLEVLEYRETYGGQVRHEKWLAQFFGRDHTQHLKLDRDIKNIAGATLSCRHITDGVNRLAHTWEHVLQHIPKRSEPKQI